MKLRPDLITKEMETALAEVLAQGALKYDPRGWETQPEVYTKAKHYESFCRHMLEWKSGKALDEETGLDPIKHAFARLGMLITLIERGEGGEI